MSSKLCFNCYEKIEVSAKKCFNCGATFHEEEIEKKNKTSKSVDNAVKRRAKAIDNYLYNINNIPESVEEGNYKSNGYLVEIDIYGYRPGQSYLRL